MQPSERTIYVVDDDQAVRETLTIILSGYGYIIVCFADDKALLNAARKEAPVCILLDIFLEGKSGIQILKQLNAQSSYPAPIFIMSGRGTIPLAAEAIRAGACDFIEKPFKAEQLIEKLEAGLTEFRKTQESQNWHEPLTGREEQIMSMVVDGLTSKEIGDALGISDRTVEYHRINIMKKTHAKNVPDLVKMTIGNAHG
jgi:FixJ family two-component response regulator